MHKIKKLNILYNDARVIGAKIVAKQNELFRQGDDYIDSSVMMDIKKLADEQLDALKRWREFFESLLPNP
jgi:hypothetical protein